jgi:hypothetical protein
VLRTLLIAGLCAACGDDDAACVTDGDCPAFQRCVAMSCTPIGTPRDGGPRFDGGPFDRDAGRARDGGGGLDAGFDAGAMCVSPSDCNDGNPCTDDTCMGGRCGWTPVTGGTPCDDGVFCNGAEICIEGTCMAREPACPDGTMCNEKTRVCGCDDGDPCTAGDVFGVGGCRGMPVVDDTPCEPCITEACACCANRCVPITTELNCGTCGRRCPVGRVCEYMDGTGLCSFL